MTPLITVVHEVAGFQLASFRDRDGNPSVINETEARIGRIADGLRQCDRVQWARADVALDDVTRLADEVHAPGYLAFLRTTSTRSESVIDTQFVAPGVLPDTPVTSGAYAAALRACASAVTAAQIVTGGERYAYALCRPPGHHAGHAFLGGYCYLNNAAVAALALQRAGMRVGVLDVDYHHGNGTADILVRHPDVPFVSLHASTLQAFPYVDTSPAVAQHRFVGFDAPPSDEAYLHQLDAHLGHFANVDALVVSLGYDLIEGDPHGGWQMQPAFFGVLASRLAALRVPLVVVQEGGYALGQLAACARSLAEGLT